MRGSRYIPQRNTTELSEILKLLEMWNPWFLFLAYFFIMMKEEREDDGADGNSADYDDDDDDDDSDANS